VVELAPIAVGAISGVVEVLTLLGAVVSRDMMLLLQLIVPVSKSAFRPKLAFTHFPVPANFSFKFLLEVGSGGAQLLGLHGLDLGGVVGKLLVVGVHARVRLLLGLLRSKLSNVKHVRSHY